MSEWKEITLKEIIDSANTGLDAIKRAPIVPEDTGIKCLRIQDISQEKEFKDWGFTNVEQRNYEKFKLKKGDIIIARTGNTIGVNRYFENDQSSVFNNGLIRLRFKKDKAYPKYIYYNLRSKYFKDFIDSISGGTSTQPNMQIEVLLTLDIKLPPLIEQERIAEILSSLDDKIDLLHRQNKTLEQMAETLFRQWFVEEAEDNWETCNLENLCITISSGGTPSTKESSYYNGNINWYSTKELNDNFLFESSSKITPIGLENSSAKLFPAGTVLLAIYAAPTVGRLGILATEGTFNQAACGLVADEKKCSKEFLYLFLKSQREELNQMATGSAQQNLNVGKIKNYPLVIPTKSVFDKLKILTEPLFQKIQENTKQVKQLEQTRDTLLPKLMNGSVRVKYK